MNEHIRLYVYEVTGVPVRTLYVGSTGQSVAARMRDHRSGYHAGHLHGGKVGRLRTDLARGLFATTRERANALERQLAASLRTKGWRVMQGSGW